MLGSENGFLDIPSEAFQAPPPPIDPLPGVPAATKAPRGKSSKAVSPAPTKGWGWLKEYPYDLSKLDIHALVREMGLNPGPFARYGAGEKCRLHCILPAEHTNATDDDSAVVMVKEGELPSFHCSHSSHADSLGLRDLVMAAGAERVARFAPAVVQATLPKMPNGFLRMGHQGLLFISNKEDDSPLFLCGSHKIEALVRDPQNGEWGVLLSWEDHDGCEHRETIFYRQLAGDGVETRANLLAGGLRISSSPKARGLFIDYLTSVEVPDRGRMVSRTGWTPTGSFVLPDTTIGGGANELTILLNGHQASHAFQQAGTLKEWQDNVGRFCVGNSRLVTATAAPLAAPLLSLLQMESGGLHFRGNSSTGKSTSLFVGGSVWGGGNQSKGFLSSWRATSNGLEGVAFSRNDTCLFLDEIGEIDGTQAGETAYMLANGQQKTRARPDGSPKTVNSWTLLFLSTGEQSLADKMGEAGHTVKVGQEIRLLDIRADADRGHGMFETLHGAADGATFADSIRQAALTYYGTPSRAYLKALIQDREGHLAYVKARMATFMQKHTPLGADGQVQRVVRRFALIAAAGEMGIKMGVLPWPQGEALEGVAVCFNAWLSERGGNGPAEIQKGVEQVLRFLQNHGSSRFEDAWAEDSSSRPIFRAANRVGYRRFENDHWEYFMYPATFKKEACKGFQSAQIAKALLAAGHLNGDGAKTSRTVNVPKQGRGRYYHFPRLPVEDDTEEVGQDLPEMKGVVLPV